MSSKVRLIVLIVVPAMLILTLVFGTLLNISHIRTAQASNAIHHIPNLNTCTRGLGCDGKYPTQYQSSRGSCTAGSTNIASSNANFGNLTLYYNNNCNIWYLQSTNPVNSPSFVIYIMNGRLHFNVDTSSSSTTYSLTLYDGDYQGVVFGTMGEVIGGGTGGLTGGALAVSS